MKKINLIIVSLISLFIFTNAAFYENVKNQSADEKVLSASSSGNFELEVSVGSIIVKTWTNNQIKVEVEGLKDGDWEKVEFDQSGNTTSVEFNVKSHNYNSVTWKITLPAKYNLEMETKGGSIELKDHLQGSANLITMGGEISVKNVDGDAYLKTMGGEISVGNVGGKTELETMGGEISAGNLKGNSASVKTMGGSISIGNVASDLIVRTYGGSIAVGDVKKSIDASTNGGSIAVGKSGGDVKMVTYGGDLTLGSANGKVKVETMGGDISLKDVKGSVNASTLGGDIKVYLKPNSSGSSEIKTMSGDIRFYLSSDANATIVALIDSWNDSGSDEITSDFQMVSEDVDDDQIQRVYKVNGGDHQIKLTTNNGDIKIKKK